MEANEQDEENEHEWNRYLILPGKYALACVVDGTMIVRTFQTIEEIQEFERKKDGK